MGGRDVSGLKRAGLGVALALAALGAATPAGPAPPAAARLVHCPTGSSCETGGGNSFAPDTPVLLAGGNRVAIGAVRAGDLVLATDPRTGESAPQPVLGVIAGRVTKPLVAVALAAGAGGTPTAPLVATREHPVYVAGRGWTAARALSAGDRLVGPGGREVSVRGVDDLGTRPGATVVNLVVAGPGTFSVAPGGIAVLARAAAAPFGARPGPARRGCPSGTPSCGPEPVAGDGASHSGYGNGRLRAAPVEPTAGQPTPAGDGGPAPAVGRRSPASF